VSLPPHFQVNILDSIGKRWLLEFVSSTSCKIHIVIYIYGVPSREVVTETPGQVYKMAALSPLDAKFEESNRMEVMVNAFHDLGDYSICHYGGWAFPIDPPSILSIYP